ncbi:MAG TPA: phospho-N-acetylmuramoyl-pentapeptide-transferase, partial [Alphaproteobacteria bacterium]|nr:phospho-N-acetylmuramoyl-pentapeptide-transferase [Alphaproteobacteria bacterium]
MLYHLLYPLADEVGAFNVFRYLTFRTAGAMITALIVSFIIGPYLISHLKSKQNGGQPIREDGPETHILTKQGTPTMGGLLILIALSVSTVLWADLKNGFVWVALGVTIAFGAIGFLDDYIKISRRQSRGLPGKLKLVLEAAIATVATLWVMKIMPGDLATVMAVPFFKNLLVDLGWFFVAFAVLVIVGASNAVNLTDGRDGLAIVPVIIATGVFALIAYVVGNRVFAAYLQLSYVPGAGELSVFAGALIGG